MNGFTTPVIEYALLSPFLIVVTAAVLGVLLEALAPRRLRYGLQLGLALIGLVAALVATLTTVAGRLGDQPKASGGFIGAMGAVAIDGPTVFSWGMLLILSIMGVLLFAERGLEGGVTSFAGQASALPGTEAERQASAQGLEHTETFPLLMMATAGMMLFPAANDLLTLFVALEVFSLPLYLLCGLARRRRLLSQEAALKYFLLGAFTSGFLVYGIALTYGYAGSMGYAEIANALNGRTGGHGLLLAGMGLIAVSLLFKVGAAPFHVWTPDVYQGAPTAVTAFMAA
ncbi:MAG TPA: NADH-quinone oxidoreductase subunit N, partial [Marmoricola sp.]|nr:NADH-quinone oxidoreductase subunit N [Marmoricola sp.]